MFKPISFIILATIFPSIMISCGTIYLYESWDAEYGLFNSWCILAMVLMFICWICKLIGIILENSGINISLRTKNFYNIINGSLMMIVLLTFVFGIIILIKYQYTDIIEKNIWIWFITNFILMGLNLLIYILVSLCLFF